MQPVRLLIAAVALIVIVLLALHIPLYQPVAQSSGAEVRVIISLNYGAKLIKNTTVKPGESALSALESVAAVKTAYGGGFVKSIDGIGGNSSSQAWFYYINGLLANVGANQYILHAGDVMRWDYHPWKNRSFTTAELADFPEPLVHGYAGKTYKTVIVYARDCQSIAEQIAQNLRGKVNTELVPDGKNVDVERSNVIVVGSNTTLSKKLDSMHKELGLPYYMEGEEVQDSGGNMRDGAFAEIVQSPFNPAGTWACENAVIYIGGEHEYMEKCVNMLFHKHGFWVFAGEGA